MTRHGLGEIGERLRRSTVRIVDGRRGLGSGVIWDAGGNVITNAHVASGASAAVELWDGRQERAEVVSRDPRRDLAELRIRATDLAAAEIGSSADLRVGEMVIAVGNPLGFSGALTRGVVYGIGPLPGLSALSWVQADIRLAPGNSGGPLANAQGQVIGINTMIAGGLGLAIPSGTVQRFAHPPRVRPRHLGVTLRSVALEPGPRALGLMILDTQAGGPAAQASLLVGDIVVGVNHRPIRSLDDLEDALDARGPALRLSFLRGARDTTREVTVRFEEDRAEAA